jgi:hypothetical protein
MRKRHASLIIAIGAAVAVSFQAVSAGHKPKVAVTEKKVSKKTDNISGDPGHDPGPPGGMAKPHDTPPNPPGGMAKPHNDPNPDPPGGMAKPKNPTPPATAMGPKLTPGTTGVKNISR